MTDDEIQILPGSAFRWALALAVAADLLQIVLYPLFFEGAFSPADDALDLGVAAVLVHLLGWHWEFLPSFFAKLVPGVDLVPFWTMAVINVYRKQKAIAASVVEPSERRSSLPSPPKPVVPRTSKGKRRAQLGISRSDRRVNWNG